MPLFGKKKKTPEEIQSKIESLLVDKNENLKSLSANQKLLEANNFANEVERVNAAKSFKSAFKEYNANVDKVIDLSKVYKKYLEKSTVAQEVKDNFQLLIEKTENQKIQVKELASTVLLGKSK